MGDGKSERAQRQAAALRANLLRRKTQARRHSGGENDSAGETDRSTDSPDAEPPAGKS